MADTPRSLSTLLADIERLLLQDEPDGMLETCHYFSVRFGRDTGYLALRLITADTVLRNRRPLSIRLDPSASTSCTF
jgi:hypothetical protein